MLGTSGCIAPETSLLEDSRHSPPLNQKHLLRPCCSHLKFPSVQHQVYHPERVSTRALSSHKASKNISKHIFNSELTRSKSTKFLVNLRSKGREWIKHLKVSLVTCDSLIQRKDHTPKLAGLNKAELHRHCKSYLSKSRMPELRNVGRPCCHQRNRVVSPSYFLKLLHHCKKS